MKYLFILGRNIELSTQELISYFKKENNPILNKVLNKNGLLIELEKPITKNTINKLGGTISIGEIISSSNLPQLTKDLEKKQLHSSTNNKLNYTIWDFSENYETIQDYLKQRFKEEKLKATEKHLRKNMDLQEGEKAKAPSSKLLNEEYFLFQENKTEHFGKILYHCNYEEIEKRDINKPVQRSSLAISPRLGKILINLSEIKENETLLDPFCGVGTVLQEALLQNIKVIGVDKDRDATKSANKNLTWFKFKKEDYQVMNFDSTTVNIPEAATISTEPDLGETLKKIPTKQKAETTLRNFEKLMIQVINNLKNKISGKIVFTSPNIRIGKKRLSTNIEKICEQTEYKQSIEPIPEFRYNQIVGRMIYVLEKN